MSFRDNAAYTKLLDRARGKTPAEVAVESRRDILMTHLWERPDLYRGVPIHILGWGSECSDMSRSSARRVGSTKPGS